MEWFLTPDGRWIPVDPVREMTELAALAYRASVLNLERIRQSRMICEEVRRNIRKRQAWRSLQSNATPR